MNKTVKAFFAVVFMSVIACTAVAEDIRVQAEVDKDSVTIGDKIRYTIETSAGKGVLLEFPAPEKELGGLTVKEVLPSKREQTYILETFTPGNYTIPEQVVKYKEEGGTDWREAKTGKVPSNVASVLA